MSHIDTTPRLVITKKTPPAHLPTTLLLSLFSLFSREHIGDEMVVRLSQGKVDPTTGEAVRPEAFPARTGGGARRSMTQPVSTEARGQPSSAARPKSATMPITTPVRTWHQHQQQHQRERNAGGGQPLPPPHSRKRPEASRERGVETPRKRQGGLLAEMFERATSKAAVAEKENVDPSRDGGSQDVSEIVLACGPGRTPTRGREESPQLPPPAAALNPFAKKAEKAAAAVHSPRNFLTPPAVSAPVASQCGGAHPPPVREQHAAGCADAWARLGNGCLDGARGDEDNSPARRGIVARKRPGEQADSGAGGDVEVVQVLTVCAGELAAKPAGKRAVSSVAPGDARSDRGKKAKLGVGKNSQPPPAGKGKTMLSFFGRAAARPKP